MEKVPNANLVIPLLPTLEMLQFLSNTEAFQMQTLCKKYKKFIMEKLSSIHKISITLDRQNSDYMNKIIRNEQLSKGGLVDKFYIFCPKTMKEILSLIKVLKSLGAILCSVDEKNTLKNGQKQGDQDQSEQSICNDQVSEKIIDNEEIKNNGIQFNKSQVKIGFVIEELNPKCKDKTIFFYRLNMLLKSFEVRYPSLSFKRTILNYPYLDSNKNIDSFEINYEDLEIRNGICSQNISKAFQNVKKMVIKESVSSNSYFFLEFTNLQELKLEDCTKQQQFYGIFYLPPSLKKLSIIISDRKTMQIEQLMFESYENLDDFTLIDSFYDYSRIKLNQLLPLIRHIPNLNLEFTTYEKELILLKEDLFLDQKKIKSQQICNYTLPSKSTNEQIKVEYKRQKDKMETVQFHIDQENTDKGWKGKLKDCTEQVKYTFLQKLQEPENFKSPIVNDHQEPAPIVYDHQQPAPIVNDHEEPVLPRVIIPDEQLTKEDQDFIKYIYKKYI
eukprot:403340713